MIQVFRFLNGHNCADCIWCFCHCESTDMLRTPLELEDDLRNGREKKKSTYIYFLVQHCCSPTVITHDELR